jgi:hypothetical protein
MGRPAGVLSAQGRIDEAEGSIRRSERGPVPVLGPRRAVLQERIDAARGEPRGRGERQSHVYPTSGRWFQTWASTYGPTWLGSVIAHSSGRPSLSTSARISESVKILP